MSFRTETVFPGAFPRKISHEPSAGAVHDARYEIVKPMGSGGSAIVDGARDLDLGAYVALKGIQSERMTAAGLTRFPLQVHSSFGDRRDVRRVIVAESELLAQRHRIRTLGSR